MRPLRDVGSETFSWRPVKGQKKTVELYAGGEVFGTLRWQRNQPATATTADGTWSIDKGSQNVTVRAEDGAIAATYTAGKRGEGTLTFADGQTFRWAGTGGRTAERAFYDAAGRRIVRFWKDWRLLSVTDRGAADPGMSSLSEFPLLVIMGRYIGIGMDGGDDGAVVVMLASTAL